MSKRLRKTLLVGLILGMVAGCSPLQPRTPTIPTIPKPTVEVFYKEENVCFSEKDAQVFFIYVYTLEETIEGLR